MLTIKPNTTQNTALAELRMSWKQNKSFLVYAPTGSGKTGLAAFIIDGYVKNNMRILFIAPYTILIDQTATRLIEYGVDGDQISIIWQQHPAYDYEKLIQIASADTLIRRKFPDNIDLIIVDEAHLRRKTILENIKATNAKVIGLSGTPFADFMGNYYEHLIKPTSMKELIWIGDLSPYEFYAPARPDLSNVRTKVTTMGKDYNEEDIAEIMSGYTLVGNIVQNWLANGHDLPTICFCVNVKHANLVTEEFARVGINADVMTAKTPTDERKRIIARFENGITKIIVNVGVLVAGFDSDVRCIIYARPTKSEIRWIQCLGRGLRIAQGKDKCVIFDHSGSVHRLGFPDEIEYNFLKTDSDGLTSVKNRREQLERLPKECTKCHYMKPVGVHECPQCGFKPIAMEDVNTDESRELKKLNTKEKVFTSDEKQSWWSQIKFYQKQREIKGKPVSDGWCANVYKSKFGVWPRSLHDSVKELSPEVNSYIKHTLIKYAKGKAKVQALKDQLNSTRSAA